MTTQIWPWTLRLYLRYAAYDMPHNLYSISYTQYELVSNHETVYTKTRKVMTFKTKWLYETLITTHKTTKKIKESLTKTNVKPNSDKINQLQIRLWIWVIWRTRIICIRIWADFWNQRKLVPNPATNRKYRNRRLGTKTFLEVTSVRGKNPSFIEVQTGIW